MIASIIQALGHVPPRVVITIVLGLFAVVLGICALGVTHCTILYDGQGNESYRASILCGLHDPRQVATDLLRVVNEYKQETVNVLSQINAMKTAVSRITVQRRDMVIPGLEKIQRNGQNDNVHVSYALPYSVPNTTVALIITVKCSFWNSNGAESHAYLAAHMKQSGTTNPTAEVHHSAAHYSVYANDFTNEYLLPWDGFSPHQLLAVKLDSTQSRGQYGTMGNLNRHDIFLSGYLTS